MREGEVVGGAVPGVGAVGQEPHVLGRVVLPRRAPASLVGLFSLVGLLCCSQGSFAVDSARVRVVGLVGSLRALFRSARPCWVWAVGLFFDEQGSLRLRV